MTEWDSDKQDALEEGLGKRPKRIAFMVNVTKLIEKFKRRKKNDKDDDDNNTNSDPLIERWHLHGTS